MENKTARVLLVGNYEGDGQESMQRFASVMQSGLQDLQCDVTLVQPPVLFGRFARSAHAGLGKWLGYLDKFVLFPPWLRWITWRARVSAKEKCTPIVHICDHSNSLYAGHTSGLPTVVTCHDLLAVRGALGDDTDCPASSSGKILQRIIRHGLARASVIACVSAATRDDVEKLIQRHEGKPRTELVYMGLNYPYSQLRAAESTARLAAFPLTQLPFVLHVGSNLRRKNREGVLRIFAQAAPQWDGQLVFAGQSLSPALRELAQSLGIAGRIIEISKPDNATLEALYNRALGLLFPSRFEGFGWPIIEAQACGCPVLCSNAGPLPEVAGKGGLIYATEDEKGFAAGILRLVDSREREAWVQKGLSNVKRFTTGRMLQGYLSIYQQLASCS